MKNKILLIASGLLGFLMVFSGLNKFAHFQEMPPMSGTALELMTAFANSGWLIPLLALAEILGGLLIAYPKTRALGAIVLFPVIVGILLFHIAQEPSGLPMAGVLFLINAWIIFENKDKYLPMVS
jgi:putative oxidoreductase